MCRACVRSRTDEGVRGGEHARTQPRFRTQHTHTPTAPTRTRTHSIIVGIDGDIVIHERGLIVHRQVGRRSHRRPDACIYPCLTSGHGNQHRNKKNIPVTHLELIFSGMPYIHALREDTATNTQQKKILQLHI